MEKKRREFDYLFKKKLLAFITFQIREAYRRLIGGLSRALIGNTTCGMSLFHRSSHRSAQFFARCSSSLSRKHHFYKMSKKFPRGLQAEELTFGKEVVNRVAFLREDSEFITSAATHVSTRFIFYEHGNPFVHRTEEAINLLILTNGDNQLQTIEGKDAVGTDKGLLNWAEWKQILDVWTCDNKEQNPTLRDNEKPTFIFLGLKDESVGVDLCELKLYDEETYLDHQGRYLGIPYFGVDVSMSPHVTSLVKDLILRSNSAVQEKELMFSNSWKHAMGLSLDQSALFSHGKMYFDWLSRNRFCPGCGSKVVAVHAGGKLKCTNEAKVSTKGDLKYQCPVRNATVSNISYPRTDACVITAVTNREHTKTLLSLGKRNIKMKMYSCTAGFMEPSETVEVAAKRELWEETGVVCSDIQIIMTQPWPFPGNLMIGCIAIVDFNGENEAINLGHDRELADARWFDIPAVRDFLNDKPGNELSKEGLHLPSDVSIAHSLIKYVVHKAETKL